MADFFSKAEVTSSGRPVLLRSEVECHLLSSVDIESEDNHHFYPLKSGLLILTTHRLLWLPSSSSSSTSSAAAIPLHAISHIFSTKKSLKSMFHSPRIRFQVLVSPDGRLFDPASGSGSSSGSGSKSIVLTAVVRGKGDCDGFLGKLWESWRARAWECNETSGSGSGSGSGTGTSTATSGGLYSSDGSVRMVGVAGILRKEQEMWESTDKSLQDAFQDLNALMSKAKEMVMLAEKMRQKLLSGSSSQTSGANDEDMGSKEEMQDWLLSVGIISPVTKESAGALYHQQLSRQVFARIKGLVTKPEALRSGISPSDAAITLGIAPAMAKEHLLTAESKGLLCRDISPDGFRFYINLFPEIDPRDVYLVKDYGICNTWIKAVSTSGLK
ncbi:vacuolar protein sorting-associated protein 36 isoform X3 [Durio zibethinus]|uniref:Vacuolar protein-sorting-associated protein 36 n=1 Tax=Durio zibethinus TaxID=66656 RepID=A0A6P5Z728_DURZI|nr:vacuolar protein sorting-associated protein 36 isoform X3 [Durio zibethinus]